MQMGNSPVALWVTVHGGQGGQSLEGGAAAGEGLQEQLLVRPELGHPHLVMEQLDNREKMAVRLARPFPSSCPWEQRHLGQEEQYKKTHSYVPVGSTEARGS